jgi:hypothetical protein
MKSIPRFAPYVRLSTIKTVAQPCTFAAQESHEADTISQWNRVKAIVNEVQLLKKGIQLNKEQLAEQVTLFQSVKFYFREKRVLLTRQVESVQIVKVFGSHGA